MTIEYHEPPGELSSATRDIHRALSSLAEELEAVDWYQHRIELAEDDELRGILSHNRNEEFEHAAMALEWLRRHMPEFDERLRRYLFTDQPIPDIAKAREAATGSAGAKPAGLGIGSMRKGEAS